MSKVTEPLDPLDHAQLALLANEQAADRELVDALRSRVRDIERRIEVRAELVRMVEQLIAPRPDQVIDLQNGVRVSRVPDKGAQP